MLIMGLAVYGSDFDALEGRVLLVGMGLSLLGVSLGQHFGFSRSARSFQYPLRLLLLVIFAYAYSLVHFNYWNENSLLQAFAFAAVAVASGLLSWLANPVGGIRPASSSRDMTGAMALLGVCWWCAWFTPFAPMLLLILMTAILPVPEISNLVGLRGETSWQIVGENTLKSSGTFRNLLRWSAFLAGMMSFLLVWDAQLDRRWAIQLGVSYLAAAGFCRLPLANLPLLVFLAFLDLLAVYFIPSWLLLPGHSIVAGALLGVAASQSSSRFPMESRARGVARISFGWYWLFGIVCGLAIFLNRRFSWSLAALAMLPLFLELPSYILARWRLRT